MTDKESILAISIREVKTDNQPVFLFNITLDGKVIAANESLSSADSQAVRNLSKHYNRIFESRFAPNLVSENLKPFGVQLFKLWLEKSWQAISEKLPKGNQRIIVISSEITEILNLPWELMCLAGGKFIGLDAKFTIRRLPSSDGKLSEADETLPPKPLRVLFMACAPRDEVQLDFEREEEALLRVMAKAGVAFEYCDYGTFDELRDRINEFEPYIVHLTGHGVVNEKDKLGYFAFEDEKGYTDLRSSEEMREQLFSGSRVKLAFISGCQTAKAPPIEALGGICQGIVSEEIPLAIGWAASIADNVATQFATSFYDTVAKGQTVDRALTQARQAILQTCENMGYPGWTLPLVYSSSLQAKVFDKASKEVLPERPNVKQEALPGMLGGYTEHFVGRRREIQRLLPALRDGAIQSLILTGLGGAGKSTLATKIARKLEALGFRLIIVSSSKESPLSASRLLQACSDVFLDNNLRDEYDILNDAGIPADARLRYIVSTLNEHRFLLVLDNFEENLDETSRRILDEEIAAFYAHLITHLSGASRTIVTCRYLPAGVKLPSVAREEALGEFPESAFLKFLWRESAIEERYYNGDLPKELLSQLHDLLGGTPRFLLQIREVLKTMTAAELKAELAKVKLAQDEEAGVLQKQRDEYCEAIFTSRLYGYLSEDSRRALSRAAVYGIAITVEGIGATAGIAIDEAKGFLRQWQDYALAYQERESGKDDLWSVYGLLRGWLLSPKRLSVKDKLAAHQAAGDFLREIVNQKRSIELELNWIECLTEARAQYLEAKDYQQAREVTDSLSGYLVRQGLYKDLAMMNEELLNCEEHPIPMLWIARSFLDRGEYKSARQWYEESLKAAGEDLLTESAEALHGLATIDVHEGNYQEAREKFFKALEMHQQIGNRAGQAQTLHNLATIDLREGKYKEAREKFFKALEMHQQIGDRVGEADTLHQLASIDLYEGSYKEAREKFIKVLEMRQQIGDRAGEGVTLHNLASIDMEEGNYQEAREKFIKVLEMRQQIGDRAGEAVALHNLATIDLYEGNYKEAREKFIKVLEMHQQIGDRAGQAQTLHNLATIDLREGNYQEAREKFIKVLEMSQQIGNRAGQAQTLHQLASIDLREGNYQEAREKFIKVLEMSQQIGDRAGEAVTLHQLASIDLNEGNYKEAREKFIKVLEMRQQIGDRAGEATTFYQIGFTAFKSGKLVEGMRLVALCFLIDQSIGHGETQSDLQMLSQMAAQLNYTQEQFDAMFKEVIEEYQKDRGWALIRAAFPES
jgi:tetratricopeptide (TPR) repeat protein